MAHELTLEIVTPTRVLYEGKVDEVVAPGIEGEFGVLPGHTPFLTFLATGVLSYKVDGIEKFVAVDGGFIEVTPTRVIAIVDEAEHAEDIDLSEAERMKEEAEQRLKELSEEDKEFLIEKTKLTRALNLIKVAKRLK